MTAPDPGNCHFYRNGWYDRFKAVGAEALGAYLSRHPELEAKRKQGAAPTGEEDDGAPFSNC